MREGGGPLMLFADSFRETVNSFVWALLGQDTVDPPLTPTRRSVCLAPKCSRSRSAVARFLAVALCSSALVMPPCFLRMSKVAAVAG